MELQENEILHAQTHIWNHSLSFINSVSLICAVELGIADTIHSHGRPITLQQLVDALRINNAKADHLARLMRLLTRAGFFLDDKDGYALAPPSCLLLKDHPFCMAPFMKGSYTIFTGPWHRVSEWFHNDDPTPFQTAHGTTFWDSAAQDPELSRYFNQAMASDTILLMSLMRKHCRGVFEGLDSLVDVGGGTGMAARAIADEFPDMKCTVLDLPHVVAGLEGTKNLTYVVGNMFEAIPPAHAVFLKWIMHDWNDEDCVTILKKCKEAIPKKENGGKVIIVDVILGATQNGDDESIQTQLFMDFLMMVYYGGRERTLKEWVKIFNDAGFTNYITTQLGSRSLIQLFP